MGVALAVLALKYAAYQATGSVALYSDALESIVNLVTAVAAFWAVKVSSRPADRNHPFGHHKAEYLSAVLEGALIIVAALLIFREVYGHLVSATAAGSHGVGLGLQRRGHGAEWRLGLFPHKPRPPAGARPRLIADGHHLLTDVLTSVGVMAGLCSGLPDRRRDPRSAARAGGCRLHSMERLPDHARRP